MKKFNFNEFAQFYCGTNNRAEQIQEFKDALISVETNDEISEAELMELFGTECEIEQEMDYDHGLYELTINGKWFCYCMEDIMK